MKRAGVIGWPVAHSLSPVLHGYWLRQYGIMGAYEKIPAAPEEFEAVIARLRGEGYAGVNVTVPHKEAAFALAQDNDAAAKLAGATNLLVFHADHVEGRNTDSYGLMASLREHIGPLAGEPVVLLGAGGAARGAAVALDQLGAGTIHLLNRDAARAASLADMLAPRLNARIVAGGLSAWNDVAGAAALAVNSSSAGMGDNPPPPIDLSRLSKDAAVCDIVYHPLETRLLQEAAARGHKTIDGLGMLMHQAAPSFEAFFGAWPDVTPGLRAALVKALHDRP